MQGDQISDGPAMGPLTSQWVCTGFPKTLRYDLSQDRCQHRVPKSVSLQRLFCINLDRRLEIERSMDDRHGVQCAADKWFLGDFQTCRIVKI